MIDPIILASLVALLLLATFNHLDFSVSPQPAGGFDLPPPKPEKKPWEDLLMFKKGGDKAPNPDPNIGKSALKNAELGEEWLKFAREQFDVANARQEDLDELTKKVGEQQLATQDQANRWAQEDRQRYEETFRPIEDEFVEQARTWDSPERQEQQAAEARADVQKSAQLQRQQTERNMASMGVNPASGRFAGIDRASELGTALASAGAQNSARNQVRREGMAMKADAANMGRGLPSQAASAAGLGLSAGNSALGGASNANAQFVNSTGIMGQGYQGAMGGYANQANILNQQYQNQLQAWATNQQAAAASTSGLFGAIGTGIGTWAGMQSSKKVKTNKKPIAGALEAINGLPIESWEYKKSAIGKSKPGVIPPDDKRHVGTYAEDFAKQTGIGDGESIPIQDAIGVTMKAVQELDDKVEQIAAKSGKKRKSSRATA